MKKFLLIGLLAAGAMSLYGASFRASAVKVDITPKDSQWLSGYDARRSTGVHDRIFHRVVAMDDGSTQFYLAASDFCLFSPEVYQQVAARLEKELGIPRKAFWWSVSHTHSGPELGPPGIYKTLLGRSDHEWNREYASLVTDSLIQAVRNAKTTLEPARISIGSGMSMANINRRAKDVDGKVTLGLNPDGPADRQIGIMRLEKATGSPLAVIANYSMHGTVLGGESTAISGDAPGVVAAYLEEKVGGTVLYVNGAAGNLAPIYSVYPDPESGHLSQFRVLLGDRILAALRSLGPSSAEVTLRVGEKIVETPLKPGLEWPSELRAYIREASGSASMVRLPVGFLKINDTFVWSAPVELFCEISMAIRNRVPFPDCFFFGYTNGWLGYLPTKAGFEEGGYEPHTSVLTSAAEHDLLEAVLTFAEAWR